MKMRFFTVLLVLSTITTNAQNFAPIGATWHYSYQTINPNLISFEKIESVSDTTINGILCKKLKANTSNEVNYVYSKNDSVFVYKGNSFNLLYDFGANTGETITLGSYYKTHNGLPLQMTIDSVKTILVSGQQRKVQFVTCGDGMIIEFGGQVIQGIGNTNYMFPTLDFAPQGPLRCYQETNSLLFINPYYTYGNWNKTDCEQLIVINNLPETETKNSISIFPNPTNNYLNVTGIELNSEYRIYDTTGRKVFQGVFVKSYTVDIQSLENGIYYIEINNIDLKIVRKFIKK
jgi:hypothetical protein